MKVGWHVEVEYVDTDSGNIHKSTIPGEFVL
jgi:hypothetical protein